jgi:transcriptional regulator with XRE-family HTH domain
MWNAACIATGVTLRDKRTFNFKAWRKYRGLTQERVAALVGVSVSTVSQVENGQQGFTDTTLVAWAEALGTSPGDLLSRNPAEDRPFEELDQLIEAKGGMGVVLRVIEALPDAQAKVVTFPAPLSLETFEQIAMLVMGSLDQTGLDARTKAKAFREACASFMRGETAIEENVLQFAEERKRLGK